MSAVHYYTDSINTLSPAFAYPCSDYKSFKQGVCTSCGLALDGCQRTGYHASWSRALGTLYLMTLHGVKPPHFGLYSSQPRAGAKDPSVTFLGFHFQVTLESDLNNTRKQTRGTIKVRFDEQQEDALLFEYESIHTRVQRNEFAPFSENTSLTRGTIKSKTILITNKPMALKKISISFKKSMNINYGFGLADQWNFRSVTVLDMQSQSRLAYH